MGFFKEIWKKVSNLGIDYSKPYYEQKSIILFNRIIRILLLLLVAIFLNLYFVFHIPSALNFLLALFLVTAFTLGLTLKGKIQSALFIFTGIMPLIILSFSVYTKIYNQTNLLFFFLLPRLGILTVTIIPSAIGNLKNSKIGLFSIFWGVFLYLIFDFVHQIFGVETTDIHFSPENFWMIKFALLIFVVILYLFIVFLQKLNSDYENIVSKQNEEITAQRDFLDEKNKIIERQNSKHLASLNYGKRIQNAVLPPIDSLEKDLADIFVLFKPKDRVSGDFYWKRRVGDYIYLAVADCTGHGIPGAFMSMLNLGFLNEIINRSIELQTIFSPAEILENVRDRIKKTLRQGGQNSSKEGMDIGLCLINKHTNELIFSGANFEIDFIKNGQLEVIKGDRQPVAVYQKEKAFTNHKLQFSGDKTFYLYSDGFADQIGGEKKRKYKRLKLKETLVKNRLFALSQQKKELEKELEDWMQNYEQVDDITLIGFIP